MRESRIVHRGKGSDEMTDCHHSHGCGCCMEVDLLPMGLPGPPGDKGPPGDPGPGSVVSVDGISPDSSGNVETRRIVSQTLYDMMLANGGLNPHITYLINEN